MHVECRSGAYAVLSANKSRRSLNRPPSLTATASFQLIHPDTARPACLAKNLKGLLGLSFSEPQSTLHQPHVSHTHCVIPPARQTHPLRYVICFGCFVPSERPLHPLVRISDALSPRLLLPTQTPAPVLQNRRTVQRQCRAPEDVQSRFGRHLTYQRHASSINRILPEALRAIPQAFHSLQGFVIPHR